MLVSKTICTEDLLLFKESPGPRGNYIDKPPSYAKSVFEDEYSPFRKALESVQPNTPVRLRIMLEII